MPVFDPKGLVEFLLFLPLKEKKKNQNHISGIFWFLLVCGEI
jgi:hypothetical protein